MIEALWIAIPGLAIFGYLTGRRRALVVADAPEQPALHSLPRHYGQLVALWVVVPALVLLVFWMLAGPTLVDRLAVERLAADPAWSVGQDPTAAVAGLRADDLFAVRTASTEAADLARIARDGATRLVERVFAALFALLSAAGWLLGARQVVPTTRARNRVERVLQLALMACSAVAILTTVGIVLSLLFEALRFFQLVSPLEFFFGTEWSPQTALRADQVGSSGAFGAVPIFAGTMLITAIAMSIALPVGLMAAIYLSFYASVSARGWIKPLLEVIAGIPTVVWGSFAALTLAPMVREFGHALGFDVALESALAAGLVMGVMIIPFVSSLSDDALTAVPSTLRDGSLAIGATPSETIRRVIVPAALPGIVGACLLAVSRAIGETMIVVMAAGLAANLTANPFEAVTTVTVQIVTLLLGDQEFDSAKTLAAFALGITLFFVTLGLNLIALSTVRRFREQYD